LALRFFTDILSSNEALGLNVGAGTVRAVRLVKSEKGFEIIDSVSTDFQADRPAHPAFRPGYTFLTYRLADRTRSAKPCLT